MVKVVHRREPRREKYAPSNSYLRAMVEQPGLLLPIHPRQPEFLCQEVETTEYVQLEMGRLYIDKNGERCKIQPSELRLLEQLDLPIPSYDVFDHFTQVHFLASPHEVLYPLRAAKILRRFHGDPKLIQLLEEDRADLLCLDPSAPNNEEIDENGRLYHRELIHRVNIYDLVRAQRILADPIDGHCALTLKHEADEQARGVGRLWRVMDTTHLLVWRMPDPAHNPNRPPLPDEQDWFYEGLSTFGRKGRGLIIMFDIGLFDLIYLRYLQACAFVMPGFDEHFG